MPDRLKPWMSAACLLAIFGCASRGQVELLESRLRLQEDQLLAQQAQLAAGEVDLHAARQEADLLRAQLTAQGRHPLLPEQADVLFHATGIEFNSLVTGGLDRDGQPGDDLLNVLLMPHDADGEPVKLAGDIRLELLDLAAEENEQQLGVWDFSKEQSRDYWRRGLFGTGFLFDLTWQRPPLNGELLLRAEMTTADGRKFHTSMPVKITLPPGTASIAAGESPVQ